MVCFASSLVIDRPATVYKRNIVTVEKKKVTFDEFSFLVIK